jgi:pimeloyl-ACP methyl ester carboxylesterase
MAADQYDPFVPGPFAVGVRTLEIRDRDRGRLFPCEIWYPAASPPTGGLAEERDAPVHQGDHPLVIFSHFSGGGRRTATYLTTHLASHGYAVAAMDHSEVVAPELGPHPGESAADRARRIDAIIASRVPDVRVLLSTLTGPRPITGLDGIGLDPALIAVAGHSFGGWTALAVPESEPRVRAVVALAPGGSSRPVPGVLPLTLALGRIRRASLSTTPLAMCPPSSCARTGARSPPVTGLRARPPNTRPRPPPTSLTAGPSMPTTTARP